MRSRPYGLPLAIFSFVILLLGGYTAQRGYDARDDVRAGIAKEHVTIGKDGPKHLVGKRVDSAETAQAQADVIWQHTMKATGGKTYAEMKKDDPARATAKDGAALRTGLMLAVMGFNVATLVIGLGWGVMSLGLAGLLIGVFLYFRNRD